MAQRDEGRWLRGVALAVGLASALSFAFGVVTGAPVLLIYEDYVSTVLVVGAFACIALAATLTMLLAARGVASPLAEIRQLLADRLGTPGRALGTIGPILLLPLLMGAFGTFKQVLPLIEPYMWDDVLARIGRTFFFGVAPWRITHAIFGPQATQILDRLYAGWFPLLFMVVLGMSTLAAPQLRARFMVAFTGCWLLLGVIGAFLFPSAGPCFAGLVGATSAPEFAPLVARLHAIDQSGYPLVTLALQNDLWRSHVSHSFGFGMGISAMPSMHNSIAFLYVLTARQAPRPVRVAAWIFAVTILVASVHLGWHYLVDGLIAWLATAWIWQVSARYLRWCGYAPAPVKLRLVESHKEAFDYSEPQELAA